MNITRYKISKEEVGLGLSKIGGEPDLPKGFEFPATKKGFYEFIAQINFE